jgi:hypothetical protein
VGWGALSSALLAVGILILLPVLHRDVAPRARAGLAALVGFSWAVVATGTTYVRDDVPAIGALEQVVVLGIIAWTVLQLGRIRAFNALTGLVALRVLIVYFEVFGSLLDTGLGLIFGGLLTLLLAWLWKRHRGSLAQRLSGGSDAT